METRAAESKPGNAPGHGNANSLIPGCKYSPDPFTPGCKYSPDPFAVSLRLKTRQHGAARPRVEEDSRLPEVVAAPRPIEAVQKGRTRGQGRVETPGRETLAARERLQLFRFGHGHAKNTPEQ